LIKLLILTSILQTSKWTEAIENYQQACAIFEVEEKERYAIDSYKRIVSLLVDQKKFKEAAQELQKQLPILKKNEQDHYLARALISLVIIHLAAGDGVSAKAVLDSFMNSGVPLDEEAIVRGLIDACEKRSLPDLEASKSKQLFTFLDHHVAKRVSAMTFDSISFAGDQPDIL